MGYAWFGSDNGLARYDGYVTHVFQFDAADPASLNDNRVRALYSDRQGRFWVGTQTGANCYVPDTRAFRRIGLKGHDGDFSAVNFWETPDGNLWASSTTAWPSRCRCRPDYWATDPNCTGSAPIPKGGCG